MHESSPVNESLRRQAAPGLNREKRSQPAFLTVEAGVVLDNVRPAELSAATPNVARAVHLALADVHPLLAAHNVSLSVGPSPSGAASPHTRALLARSIRTLLAMTQPASGELVVRSAGAGGLLTISLRIRCQEEHPQPAPLDETLQAVYAAAGFLSVEPEDDGFSMRLTLPAAA